MSFQITVTITDEQGRAAVASAPKPISLDDQTVDSVANKLLSYCCKTINQEHVKSQTPVGIGSF